MDIKRFDADSEEALLGMVLLDPNILSEIQLIVKPCMFFNRLYRTTYEVMCGLSARSLTPDLALVFKELKLKGELASKTDSDMFNHISDSVFTTSNYKHYAEIVKDYWQKRELADIASSILSRTQNPAVKGDELMAEIEKRIVELSMDNSQYRIYGGADIADKLCNSMKVRANNRAKVSGLATGFNELDEMTNGLQNGDLIIVGARPSIGKTALAMTMIRNIAFEHRISCGFFSAEMGLEAISDRFLSLTSRMSLQKVRRGDIQKLSMTESSSLTNAMDVINKATIHLCDAPNIKLTALRSIARRMKFEHKVKVIFVDYMGLLDAEFQGSEYERTSFISKSLKGIARELEVPVVALCQLNRDAEGNQPTLAQLRGSGSIEQDADVVMFLHRERNYDASETEVDTQLIVAKQRQGATGTVALKFRPMTTEYIEKKKGGNDEAKCPF